ncbi:complement factor H [Oryzias melastigma]|uniref:complement factor H n=1 Tax=Oryzias melastigma TaxID=30732 RepID=UPI000CF815AF|nr:complement factor H [Oryzias melastigma]
MKLQLILLLLQLLENVPLSLSIKACSELPNVPFARVSEVDRKAEYQEGDVIHFNCEEGYTSDHTSTFVCTSDGWISTRLGTCFSCSELPDIPHASVSEDTRKDVYQQGDMLRFTCDPGFRSDLPITYVCGSEGWVSIRKGSCYSTTIRCEQPPSHGGLRIKGLPRNNGPIPPDHVLTFSCDSPDKVLIGSSVLICGREGQWNNPIPTCTEVTCNDRRDRYLYFFYAPWGRRQVGNLANYKCIQGYNKPAGVTHATCTKDGWMPELLCEGTKCLTPDLDGNAQVTTEQKTSYNIGDRVTYTCKNDNRRSVTITCDRGSWTGIQSCNVASCTIPQIDHGRVTDGPKVYREDDILNYVCDNKYKPADDRPTRCLKVGAEVVWSPIPQCTQLTCKVDQPPVGTTYDQSRKNVFLPGDRLTVTCDRDHWILDAITTRMVVTCNDDGRWDVRPVCQEVTCDDRRDGYLTSFYTSRGQRKLGDRATYGCTQGYKKPTGITHAICTREGWMPEELCEAGELVCPAPPTIEDADFIKSKTEYRNGESVQYFCPRFYVMEGGPYQTCKNGKWTGHLRCIKPCSVSREDLSQNNILFARDSYKPFIEHGSYVTFTCKGGKLPDGLLEMHQQCVEGLIDLPSCV